MFDKQKEIDRDWEEGLDLLDSKLANKEITRKQHNDVLTTALLLSLLMSSR